MPTLSEIAKRFGLDLQGDPGVAIDGVCTLHPGKPGCITFLANPKYRSQLTDTQAGAVIVGKRDAAQLKVNGLIAPDPYLAFARIAALFDNSGQFTPGVHATAVLAASAHVPATVHIGPYSIVEEGAEIGEHVFIGAHCTVGKNAKIGANTRIESKVWIGDRVQLGERCRVNPMAVIGARGFGLARGPMGWEEVPQLGRVVIGNDVEIGANTTIDRGAIENTVLEDGVKLDNQIQIAHNCIIGAHTAIAACTGVAGSTRIGARCMIGGAVGIAGHIEIGDDVVILARAMVTRSLLEKGVYGSGLPVSSAREWRKTVARVRRLGHYEDRLKKIEKKLQIQVKDEEEAGEPDD